jgi:hypothetical protein
LAAERERVAACVAYCEGVPIHLLTGKLLDRLAQPEAVPESDLLALLKRLRSDLMEYWRPGGWSKADCIHGMTTRLNKPEIAALRGGVIK